MTSETERFSFHQSVTKLEEEKTKVEVESPPKIQKVQPYLRKRPDFISYYSPKLVSIGPIRPDNKEEIEDLKQGEEYKLMWAAMYLEATQQTAEQLAQKIQGNLTTLKELYTKDVIERYKNADDKLIWIFLLDGCAVLHFMAKASFEKPDELKIKVDQVLIVQRDLLLLENQLPYQLLKLLSNDDEGKLRDYIKIFFKMHHMISRKVNEKRENEAVITVDHQPTHLLDLLRTYLLGGAGHGGGERFLGTEFRLGKDMKKWPTYRNVLDLKASGIRVKRRPDGNLTDITFKRPFYLRSPFDWNFSSLFNWSFRGPSPFSGRLYLYELIVDDFTAPTFLNLIAYEMCPDFKTHYYEVSSYVAFLDSLIDHPDDVKELRKAEVLHNVLGSDDEVAKLFNTISLDLVPDTQTYVTVRTDIENHYSNKCLTWVAQAYTNHFSTPWAIIGFAAAFIALFLEVLQTWPQLNPVPPRN